MKRVLLISYRFPPEGGAQSQSVAKLAKGLAERGWELEVLTVLNPPTYLVDDHLLAELPHTVHIRRAYSLEPTRLVQAFRRIKTALVSRRASAEPPSAQRGARYYTSLPRGVVDLAKALFVPDEKVGWTPWAVREAMRIHSEKPVDVIVSDGPPYTAHGIAWRVARRLHLPWLAILMDPVFGCYAFPPATPIHAILMRRYERKICKRAAHLTIATEGMRRDMIGRNPEVEGRVTVCSNGYDPKDYEEPAPGPHEGFVISYVGAFQRSITPDLFLDAVARLLGQDDSFSRDVRVRLVGPRHAGIDHTVARYDLDSVVEQAGPVSHAEAVQQMRASDVLLLILGPEPESCAILTTKLPEYLAAGKPVLALVPVDGVAADTVRRARAGEVADPRDPHAAADALAHMYRMWKTGTLPVPTPDVVGEFSWDAQLREVDRILRRLTGLAR